MHQMTMSQISSNFFDHLEDFKWEETIPAGDLNLVLNVKEDKKGGLLRTHQNAFKVVKQACEGLELNDVRRTMNPYRRRYTWRRKIENTL